MEFAKFAGVLIFKDNKVLMVQEKHEQAYGLWSLPLGHVEEGESFGQAAIREAKEETGYNIELISPLEKKIIPGADFKSSEGFLDKTIELQIFFGRIIGGNLNFDQNDELDAKWLAKEEIKSLPLRGQWLESYVF